MKLYDTQRSGNAWKVRLLAGLLGLSLSRETLSIDRGDLARESFRAIAPLGQVPVLALDDGSHLSESLAILYYLAQGTEWWPAEPAAQARVLAWMAFEQERHMKPLAQLRLNLALHRRRRADEPEMLAYAHEARAALRLLEQQMQRQGAQAWVATAGHPSIADVALYPYTCLAPMGGVGLDDYPAIRGWLARIEQLPGYQPLFPGAHDRNFSTSES